MIYDITIREEWYKDDRHNLPKSRWNWEVYDDDVQLIDQGSNQYSERDARISAERAATLHYRQKKAKVVTYEFTPEG